MFYINLFGMGALRFYQIKTPVIHEYVESEAYKPVISTPSYNHLFLDSHFLRHLLSSFKRHLYSWT